MRIGAAALFAFGVFQAAMTLLGAEFVNRPYIDSPYALTELTGWLVDTLGRLGAAIVFVVAFSACALILLNAARNPRD